MSDTPSGGYGNAQRAYSQGGTGEDPQLVALQQLSLNARILSTVNPWMGDRPDIMMELVQSGLPPDTLAQQGAGLYGMQNIDGLRGTLQGLTPAAQRSVYSRLTVQQQMALNNMGYSEPMADTGDRGLLGDVGDAVGKVTAPVWGGVSQVGGPVLKKGLDLVTFMADQPGHLYRTIRMMDDWQQALALSAAVAAVALTPVTFGGSLAVAPTLVALGTLGGAGLAAGTAAAAATGPQDWWSSLNATWDGEKVFERGAQRHARELLVGDQFLSLAKSIALDLDPYDLAADIAGRRGAGENETMKALEDVAADYADKGSPEYETIFGGLMTLVDQEPFRQAIDALQRGKISFGRDIADSLGMDQSSTMHRLTSGMLDGVWAVSMDPTLALGKIVKWDRVRRYGVGVAGGDDFVARLGELYHGNRAVRNTFDSVAAAIETGDVSLAPPAWRGMLDPINEYVRANKGIPIRLGDDAAPEVFEAADLLEYFRHGDGVQRLLQGKATVRGVEHAILSRRNETAGWGRVVRELREFRDGMDDVMLEANARRVAAKNGEELHLERIFPENVLRQGLDVNINYSLAAAERQAGQTGRLLGTALGRAANVPYIGAPLRTVGSLMSSITRMAPAGRSIILEGAGAETDLPRFIEMMGRATNMPSGMRNAWLNEVFAQGSHAQRIEVLQSFQDTALSLAGLRSNVELAGLADTYLTKYKQVFALGGLDETVLGGIPAATGILPDSHQAVMLVLPDLREMTAAIRRGHVLKHVARITDSNFVEASMSRFWKPAVLIRLGFIPRAAGEEALAWVARMTTGGVMQEFGARSLAMHEMYRATADKLARNPNAILSIVEQEALKWKTPTMLKPLVNMMSRMGWKEPADAFVENYVRNMDHWLGEGIGREIHPVEVNELGRWHGIRASQSRQWYHGLLYGREASWRRLTMEGVNPQMRASAKSWVEKHGRAVMSATSAMNASAMEKSVVAPELQMINVPDGKGGIRAEPLVTMMGERVRVGASDWRYKAAISHRQAEIVQDNIIGPILRERMLHYFAPELGLEPQQLLTHLEAMEGLDFDTRRMLLNALEPRQDNWRAVATMLAGSDDQTSLGLGAAIDDALIKGDVSWDDLIDNLKAVANHADTSPEVAVNLDSTARQMRNLKPTLEFLDSLPASGRSWLAGALTAQTTSGGAFYDLNRIRSWVDGLAPDLFHADRAGFEARLQEDIAAALARPENAEKVRRSRFTQQTANGELVAHPMQSGTQRVHVPYNQGNFLEGAVASAMLENPRNREELIDTIVDKLLRQPGAFRTHTDYIVGLSDFQRRMALGTAVDNYLERVAGQRSRWTRPMHGIGYDEPRLAAWVGDVVSGSALDRPPMGQYVVDLARPGTLKEGPTQLANLNESGRVWKLGDEHFGRTYHLATDGVVTMGDQAIAGVSYEEALADWSRNIVRKIATELGAGTHESYLAKSIDALPAAEGGMTRLFATGDGAWSTTRKTPGAGEIERYVDVPRLEYRRMRKAGGDLELSAERAAQAKDVPLTGLQRSSNRQLRAVRPGERLVSKEDLFDVNGEPVAWGDRRFLEPQVTTSDEFLHSIFMPMMRDQMEWETGFANVVPKSVAASNGAFEAGTRVPKADQWVHMTRSRISDVDTPGLALPNVAVTEISSVKAQNTVWDRVVRWGFDEVIGPSLDALVRKPMSYHYYNAAHAQNMTFRSGFLNRDYFDVQVPRVFGQHIADVDAATTLTAKQLDAARTLARDVYQIPIDGASDMEVAEWLASLAKSDDEFIGEMTRAHGAADRAGKFDAREATQELMGINHAQMRMMGAKGSADTPERLVAAYYENIPEHIWQRGAAHVNQYIEDAAVPLRKLEGREQWQTMLRARNNYAQVTEMLEDTARQRAIENVVPFLDSHEQRTQFAVISRNLLPFWYAEENFLRRWARTMALDGTMGLATIRKAQLSYMGIKSAGIVRTDANGKDWFVYPGSGLLAESLSKLPFIPDTLPVGVMFQASVESMMPGVNSRFGTPSVSPWVALGLDTVTTVMPDAVPLRNALLGQIGAQQSRSGGIFGSMRHFVPSTAQRFWEAAFGDEDSSRRYASAMAAAMAFMEANDQGLSDTATPEQEDAYLDKVRNHARVIMWAQLMTGFVVPGAPVAVNTGDQRGPMGLGSFSWLTGMGVDNPAEMVSQQYRSYVDNLGIDEGTSRFLADFPDSTLADVVNPLAFTVSATTSRSGAPLPANRTAMQWYTDHQDWVDSMPEAGAWFLPPDDPDDPNFDYYSYSQQLTSELRQRRTPADFLRALKYRQGAATYFQSRDGYEAAAAQLKDNDLAKRKLDEMWDTWQNTWLTSHPIFAEELVSGEAKARRARTIKQLRYGATDPSAPPSPHTEAIAQMSKAFDTYKVALMQLNEHRDKLSVERARKLRELFEDWATGWVVRNPQLEQLWNAVYRPEAQL